MLYSIQIFTAKIPLLQYVLYSAFICYSKNSSFGIYAVTSIHLKFHSGEKRPSGRFLLFGNYTAAPKTQSLHFRALGAVASPLRQSTLIHISSIGQLGAVASSLRRSTLILISSIGRWALWLARFGEVP